MRQYVDSVAYNVNKLREAIYSFNLKKRIKDFLYELTLLWDDISYRYYFNNTLSKIVYDLHSMDHTICCIFCSHLAKSRDSQCSFTCTNKTYTESAPLLPGIFSYPGRSAATQDYTPIPWFFKAPCKDFQRLGRSNYFRNFNYLNGSVSTANYENIEGILFGICRGKRPCHICASVDAEILNQCIKDEMSEKESPCSLVRSIIASHYRPK